MTQIWETCGFRRISAVTMKRRAHKNTIKCKSLVLNHRIFPGDCLASKINRDRVQSLHSEDWFAFFVSPRINISFPSVRIESFWTFTTRYETLLPRVLNQRSTGFLLLLRPRLHPNHWQWHFINIFYLLQIFTMFSLTVCVGHVIATHCNIDTIRTKAIDACNRRNRIPTRFSRQADFSDFGYEVEFVKGELTTFF